ncbi:MAG: hypothetical protein JSS68_21300 [Actinobacteria bacterium]|nr:hypothetical protein [Actinomycetota bacterium]
MLRRAGVALLAVIAICLLAGEPAGATISNRVDWDVDLTGKVTTKWTFAGTNPESCSDYLGSPSFEANGSRSQTLTVATTAKHRLAAETCRLGRKLRFSSFSTDGWRIPATLSKVGSASTRLGGPCAAYPGDPEPLPEFSDPSGCGTTRGTTSSSLTWTPGELVVDLGTGPPEPLKWITRCLDIGDPKLAALTEATCEPKGLGAIYLGALKFMLPKPMKFTVESEKRFLCRSRSPTPTGARAAFPDDRHLHQLQGDVHAGGVVTCPCHRLARAILRGTSSPARPACGSAPASSTSAGSSSPC